MVNDTFVTGTMLFLLIATILTDSLFWEYSPGESWELLGGGVRIHMACIRQDWTEL